MPIAAAADIDAAGLHGAVAAHRVRAAAAGVFADRKMLRLDQPACLVECRHAAVGDGEITNRDRPGAGDATTWLSTRAPPSAIESSEATSGEESARRLEMDSTHSMLSYPRWPRPRYESRLRVSALANGSSSAAATAETLLQMSRFRLGWRISTCRLTCADAAVGGGWTQSLRRNPAPGSAAR